MRSNWKILISRARLRLKKKNKQIDGFFIEYTDGSQLGPRKIITSMVLNLGLAKSVKGLELSLGLQCSPPPAQPDYNPQKQSGFWNSLLFSTDIKLFFKYLLLCSKL